MSERTIAFPEPHAVLPVSSTNTPPSVLTQEVLSSQDKYELYVALQNIANELRRIRRERKKNQQAK